MGKPIWKGEFAERHNPKHVSNVCNHIMSQPAHMDGVEVDGSKHKEGESDGCKDHYQQKYFAP